MISWRVFRDHRLTSSRNSPSARTDFPEVDERWWDTRRWWIHRILLLGNHPPRVCVYCGIYNGDQENFGHWKMSHRRSGTKIRFLVPSCYVLPRSLLLPRSTRNSAEPVKRLWRTLVHQESIKELFIQNIFKREMASTEEVSSFLISLLFPISFSFSSFLAFFPPSSLLLWLSLSSPSSNSFHTSLSPSLDLSPFLFFLFPSSLLLLSYLSILPRHLLIPCLLSVPTLLFSFLLCLFFPIFFSLRAPFSAISSPSPFDPARLSSFPCRFLYEPFCGYARDWVTVVSNCNMGLFRGRNIEPVSCTAS